MIKIFYCIQLNPFPNNYVPNNTICLFCLYLQQNGSLQTSRLAVARRSIGYSTETLAVRNLEVIMSDHFREHKDKHKKGKTDLLLT